jgi:hypothetical protein
MKDSAAQKAHMKKAGAFATGFFHRRENPACQSWESSSLRMGLSPLHPFCWRLAQNAL